MQCPEIYVIFDTLRWYGTSFGINVDWSTLKLKYFQRFKILNFYNIEPQNTFLKFLER